METLLICSLAIVVGMRMDGHGAALEAVGEGEGRPVDAGQPLSAGAGWRLLVPGWEAYSGLGQRRR